MFAIANEVHEIGPLWKKAKSDLRNRLNALRQKDRNWLNLSITGWVECDPITLEDFSILGTHQRLMLSNLNAPCWQDGGFPAWVVHMHAVVHHPLLESQEIGRALSMQWPGDRRVDIQPFTEGRDPKDNLRATVTYATKFRAGRWIAGTHDFWPASWMASYYSWVDEYSRGWQSLRFRMKDSNNKFKESDLCNPSDCIEPMYTTCLSNSFHILYTDGRGAYDL